MLMTIVNGLPPPKCVIIEDSISLTAKQILYALIKSHLEANISNVHVFTFENSSRGLGNKLRNDKLRIHDFTVDTDGWTDASNSVDFIKTVNDVSVNGVIIVDSLTCIILKYGLAQTYRFLHNLINEQRIFQVIAVLHEDTVQNKVQTVQYFNRLSTLYLKLIPIENNTPRVKFRYKKMGGKIINEIEEFFIDDNVFHTKPLAKIDPKLLLANSTSNVQPENITTFKIGLDESEKKSREKLILPYLKTSEDDSNPAMGGNIIYNLDDDDDWDDEDPDDDLDI